MYFFFKQTISHLEENSPPKPIQKSKTRQIQPDHELTQLQDLEAKETPIKRRLTRAKQYHYFRIYIFFQRKVFSW